MQEADLALGLTTTGASGHPGPSPLLHFTFFYPKDLFRELPALVAAACCIIENMALSSGLILSQVVIV